MFYKESNTIKYSFLVGSIVCLLSTTALSQGTLPEAKEASIAPNVQIAIDSSGATDELLPAKADIKADININPTQQMNSSAGPATAGNGTPESQPLISPQPPIQGAKQEIPALGNQEASPQASENAVLPEDKPLPEGEDNAALKAYNEFTDAADRQALNKPEKDEDESTFSDKIMNQVKEDLFSQMADIEKQTGLLTLELKREKIKNEIAAMKAQRQKAIDEEKEKERERARKQAEWEKEQERLLLEEQRKLEEVKIRYESLRQERVLKAYKESMLKNNQDWVEYNSRLYGQLIREEESQSQLIEKQKEFFANILTAINRAGTAAEAAKEKYTKEVSNLQTQISILKAKLEAEKEKRKKALNANKEEDNKPKANPFAMVDDETEPKKKIAEEYAIMEISGKGEALVAKLINKKGGTFMVKPGTVLNTGHVIEEITQTYITADRGGIKDYLYFSAGGILDKEPTSPLPIEGGQNASDDKAKLPSVSSKAPSLREGMYLE